MTRALERLNQSATGAADDGKDALETPEELSYRRAIEQEKEVYKDAIERLKVLKPEIEMLRKMIEKSRATLDAQFNQWYEALHRRSDLLTQAQPVDESVATLPLAGTKGGGASSVSSSLSTLAEAKDSFALPNGKGAAAKAADRKGGGPPFDDDVDSDISAFYQAKEELLKQRAAGGR